MAQDLIRYRISQLRQDKIIYAVESVALTALSLLLYLSLPELLPNIQAERLLALKKILVASSGLYWLYVVMGNTQRLLEIKRLERTIYGNDKS